MRTVSQAYKEQMRKPIRNRSYVKIRFMQIDVGAAADGQYVDNGHEYLSEWGSVDVQEYKSPFQYGSLETNRFILDGTMAMAPDPGSQVTPTGFVSNKFDGGVRITRSFQDKHGFLGLTFRFDTHCGDYPTNMVIRYLNDGAVVDEFTVEPDAPVYVVERRIERMDGLEIELNAMNLPGRRPRIESILYGIEKIFEVDRVESVAQVSDVDPISRRLPTETLEFSLLDYEREYDPDNTAGYWSYIDSKSPIYIAYGYELDDGSIEWLPYVRYELSGRPMVAGQKAKFTASGLLDGMARTYYKATFSSKTLYDMAVSVLEDAGLPLTASLEKPWVLDSSLKSVITTGLLPIATHKECLQLIAHAGCCKLYTDDNNVIHIEKMVIPETPEDITIDLNCDLGEPSVSKIEPLYAINVKKYSYSFSDTASELHKSEITVNGDTEFHAEFSAATSITVSVSGATIKTQNIYAQAVDLILTGSGTATVTVTGKSGTQNTSGAPVAVSEDARGETETLENPLITTDTMRATLAGHVSDYLKLRSAYTTDYRGNPEIQTGDLINMESPFTPQFPAVVLKHTIDFDGGLSGNMIAKAVIK